MKRILNILSFLLLLIILTAETCSDSTVEVTREDRLSGVFRNIEDEFVNEELTAETLKAFEKRAVQKLNDLTDYLNIYADTCLSEEFRFQAREMVLGAFNSEMDLQTYFKSLDFIEDTTIKILNLSEEEGVFITEIDSVNTVDYFHKTILGYSGTLQFSQKIVRVTLTDRVVVKTFNSVLEIIISKNKKQFGDNFQDVWEVNLGEIE
jgi:hypothetical protein